MTNNFVPRLIFSFLFSLFLFQNLTAEINWSIPQDGNKIILIRHASAPGGGDPKGFNLDDCKTQRNLDKTGIEQSKKIGMLFKVKKIPIDKVLTSQWCRCKDTAKFAFNKYTTFNALNSFYDSRFEKNKDKQVMDLKKYILDLNSKKNIVLITHFVVISEILNISASSGEIIVSDREFNIIGRYK